MILRALVLCGLAMLAGTGLTACQSTQSRSAELEEEGSKVLLSEEGLEIDKESTDVKVTGTAVLSDRNGSAVVVDLHNSSNENLVNVPILVEVLDAKGKSVYSNAIPGIEPQLAAVPYIPSNGDVGWVNDQVLASGRPKSVKVTVGETSDTYSGEMPDIEVTSPTIEGDPVSGIAASGDVVNKTGEEQERLLLYAIARKGKRAVAAGRGAIELLKATPKPLHYDIFFIGDPKAAEVEITQFPTLPGFKSK